ncbi:Zn-ribbon domain-containing OB-fold protein [Paraburkholderia sp. MM6662-R1]|uniref:Zn-ribbon domain-containing OB-fold protein n=1 Tax=Paraburkholderia sp. MM6662-R1 TaxID=2991066 RepID=UPI003D1D7B04
MSTEMHSTNGWPQPYRLLDAQPYWEALQEEQLKYQRCASCDQPVWPAHSYCPHCGSGSLEWKDSRGRGTVYSFSTVMRGPTPVWASIVPYTVGFVQMVEGYFMFTQIDGASESIAVGKSVQAHFIRRGEQTLPVFSLVP